VQSIRIGAERFDQHGPLTDQQVARPMQHQHRLLVDVLDRNKTLARHRCANRLGVGRVVLVALDGMGRRHELRLMFNRLARPMMRRTAGFHADKAGFLGAEIRADLCAARPSLDDHFSGGADAVFQLGKDSGMIAPGSRIRMFALIRP
jgi:hypothetical protein